MALKVNSKRSEIKGPVKGLIWPAHSSVREHLPCSRSWAETQHKRKKSKSQITTVPPPGSIPPQGHDLPLWLLPGGHTFVAELPAPVGLTEALPGLIAGAMDTSRVRDALIAVQALPAILAPADRQHAPS
jgi:hypothetical protein